MIAHNYQLFGIGIDSANRMQHLLHALVRERDRNPELFWQLVGDVYSSCDATWCYRSWLLDEFRSAPARPTIDKPLQWPLKIYRGCSKDRVRGISWTTSREVALRFAAGHRCIPVWKPVVAEAVVHRDAVFLAIDDRSEHEVLVDPRRLRQLEVQRVADEVRR